MFVREDGVADLVRAGVRKNLKIVVRAVYAGVAREKTPGVGVATVAQGERVGCKGVSGGGRGRRAAESQDKHDEG